MLFLRWNTLAPPVVKRDTPSVCIFTVQQGMEYKLLWWVLLYSMKRRMFYPLCNICVVASAFVFHNVFLQRPDKNSIVEILIGMFKTGYLMPVCVPDYSSFHVTQL